MVTYTLYLIIAYEKSRPRLKRILKIIETFMRYGSAIRQVTLVSKMLNTCQLTAQSGPHGQGDCRWAIRQTYL